MDRRSFFKFALAVIPATQLEAAASILERTPEPNREPDAYFCLLDHNENEVKEPWYSRKPLYLSKTDGPTQTSKHPITHEVSESVSYVEYESVNDIIYPQVKNSNTVTITAAKLVNADGTPHKLMFGAPMPFMMTAVVSNGDTVKFGAHSFTYRVWNNAPHL